MSTEPPAKSPAETLAKLVAQRKAAAAKTSYPGRSVGPSERDAAARSASKSKPAMRK